MLIGMNNMKTISIRALSELSDKLKKAIQDKFIKINEPITVKMGLTSLNTYPILISAILNDTELACFLMQQGADTSLEDDEGRTIINYASNDNNERLVDEIKQYEAARKIAIEEKAHEIVRYLAEKIPSTDVSPQIDEEDQACSKKIKKELIKKLRKNKISLQVIHKKLDYLDTDFYRSIILSSSHNLLRGSHVSQVYWGSFAYFLSNDKSSTFLKKAISFISVHSIQLEIFNHLFNALQVLIIFYKSDKEHFPIFNELWDQKNDLFEFQRIESSLSNETSLPVFKQEASSNNADQKMMLLIKNQLRASCNPTMNFVLGRQNTSLEEIIIKYASIDNPLRLAIATYDPNKLNLIKTLATKEKSKLFHLAEVLVELFSFKPFNSHFLLTDSNEQKMPVFLTDKSSFNPMRQQEQEAFVSKIDALASTARKHNIRPTFFFSYNQSQVNAMISHESEAIELHNIENHEEILLIKGLQSVVDVIKHDSVGITEGNVTSHLQLTEELYNMFIERCHALAKDSTKRLIIGSLMARGDAFHAEQEYSLASFSYRAAQLFYSMIQDLNFDDHSKMLDLFLRHAHSIKLIEPTDSNVIPESDYKDTHNYIHFLKNEVLTKNEWKQLTRTEAYLEITTNMMAIHEKDSSTPPAKPCDILPTSNGRFFQSQTTLDQNKITFLYAQGEDYGLEFRRAASAGKLGQMKRISAIKPNIVDSQGATSKKTALHQAIISKQLHIVEYLVNTLHANTRIRDIDGKSPIDYINDDDMTLRALFYQPNTPIKR
jgi:hypothetical protein